MKSLAIALAAVICILFTVGCGPAVLPSEAESANGAVPADVSPSPVAEAVFRGKVISADTVMLSLQGETLTDADMEELLDSLPLLPLLEAVDLTGASVHWSCIEALRESVKVLYDFPLYGAVVNSGAERIDLSGCSIDDGGAALEDAIAVMPDLTWVDLSGCGLSDEECDALNRKYDNIRIVWTVHIGGYSVRTDAVAFTPMKDFKGGVNNDNAKNFKYCTEMIALDIGHQSVTDLDFLPYMPHLKYLVLSDSSVRDITYVGELKELEFLEMFLTSVEDLSPLLGCENLRDLNYCYPSVYCAKSAMEILPQLQALERLFFCGSGLSIQQKGLLLAAFPESTEVVLADGPESTGIDWRYGQRYYEMRDLLGMYYMLAEKPKPTEAPQS